MSRLVDPVKALSEVFVTLPLAGMEAYKQRFRCQRCGACCTRLHHRLVLRKGDVQALALGLEISTGQMKDEYTIQMEKGRAIPMPCPFYLDKYGCKVYRDRPLACRAWPVITPQHGQMAVSVRCPESKRVAEIVLGVNR